MTGRGVRIGATCRLVLLLGIAATVSAAAQTERGAIVGVVKDTNGGVLSGASVTVTRSETAAGQTYVTNAEGVYEAPFLIPGVYRVQVAMDGFAPWELAQVEVNIGSRVTASATLQPAGVQAEVTVTSQAPLVQTSSATVGQTLDTRTLVELPSGDRNVYDFLALNSNVAAPAGGNAPAFRLESGGSFAISGTRPSSVTFKIDGLTNTDPGFGTPTITPSLDSVQEFQVQNNAYSAEYEGIGQVNVATRAGTGRLRGSLFEFARNEALQPTNPILNRKTRLRFNQFGGTVGGPLLPGGQTFFFFSYEGRRHDTLGVAQAYVPPPEQRAGDFSGVLGACLVAAGQPVPQLRPEGTPSGGCVRQGQIFDPATTVRNPAFNGVLPVSATNPQFIRQPFDGNRIPAARLNDSVRRLIDAQLPMPNFGDALNNYTGESGLIWENRGGLTPALSTVCAVLAAVRIPVRVMVRESEAYDVSGTAERDRLCAAAHDCRKAGVGGLVLGFLRRGPSIDLVTTMEVLAAAPGLPATFHHAFDECGDVRTALRQLRACRRIDTVLTHGVGRRPDRLRHLTALGRAAADLTVMVGGGVDAKVIQRLRPCAGVGAFHVGRAAREPARADGRVTAWRVRALARALRAQPRPQTAFPESAQGDVAGTRVRRARES